ncbi:MAG: hypothetical protein L3J24_04230 [Xanthomonadales bacterium]|nr:hypothetical protein [Xanthomonadales bacterium]
METQSNNILFTTLGISMKNTILVLFLIGFSSVSSAMSCNTTGTYCSNVVITKIMVRDNGQILLGTEEVIPGTCSYYGHSLQINMNDGTDADDPMFSSLLTFLSQKKKIHLGIKVSTVAGTNQDNGCTVTSPSVIRDVRATFNAADYGPDEIVPPGDELVQ